MRSLWPGSVPTKEGQRSGQRRGAGGSSGAGCVPTQEGCRSAPERWVVRVAGRDGVLGFGSLRWLCGLEEVKAQSPAITGQPVTKIPKIPKIPIALDDTGELKQLP